MTIWIALRKTVKFTVLIVVACVFAIILLRVVNEYRLFRRSLTVSNNVRLTDNKAEVMYRLGKPTEVSRVENLGPFSGLQRIFTVDGPAGDKNTMPEGSRPEDFAGWIYERANGNGRMDVAFDKAGGVESIGWYSENTQASGWGPIAGVRNGDDEETALSLGSPSSESVDIKNGTKTIIFADIGLELYFVKGRAYSVTLKHPNGGEGAILWRFMHTMLP